jgi:hypothetical protein
MQRGGFPCFKLSQHQVDPTKPRPPATVAGGPGHRYGHQERYRLRHSWSGRRWSGQRCVERVINGPVRLVAVVGQRCRGSDQLGQLLGDAEEVPPL